MKIELRAVRHNQSLSQETQCFSCTIYVDGVRRGTAHNHGHGGETMVEPSDLLLEMNAYAKTLPRVPYSEEMSLGDDPEENSFEQQGSYLVDTLIGDWLIKRDIKALLAGRLVYTLPGVVGVMETAKPVSAARIAEVIAMDAFAQEKLFRKPVRILNGLPIEEVVEIVRAHEKSQMAEERAMLEAASAPTPRRARP